MKKTYSAAELEDLKQRTRNFIRDVVMPNEPRPGEYLDADVRQTLMRRAKEAGVFAPHVPKEFGGLGLPIEHWSPIFQEAGYSPIGPAVLNCMAPDEGNMGMMEEIATKEQQERYLGPLARGEVRSCFAMTEPHPGAGSDPSALRTLATKVEGGWVINGDKRFISGAVGASFGIVMSRNEAYEGIPEGATMLFVEMDNPGVSIGEQINTIDRSIEGGHPYVHFNNCFVEDSAVLGEPGLGFKYAQVRLGPARLTHCMRWLGLARRSFDIALDRARTREMFGEHMQNLGTAQNMIAESVIDLETADAMTQRAATLLAVDAKAGTAMSSIAKAYASEAIFRVIDRSIQLCGGDGVSDGLPLAQYLNEVRPFRIYDGSNETHKWAIARRASARRKHEIDAGAPVLDEVGRQTYDRN